MATANPCDVHVGSHYYVIDLFCIKLPLGFSLYSGYCKLFFGTAFHLFVKSMGGKIEHKINVKFLVKFLIFTKFYVNFVERA